MSEGPAQTVFLAAGLVRRDEALLLVRQRGQGQDYWMVPGGRAPSAEEVLPTLLREVWERTGLVLRDPPARAAFGVQVTGPDLHLVLLAFEGGEWEGEAPADPERAQFLPLPEAMARIAQAPVRYLSEPLLAYLRDEEPAGTVWCFAQVEDGTLTPVVKIRPGPGGQR